MATRLAPACDATGKGRLRPAFLLVLSLLSIVLVAAVSPWLRPVRAAFLGQPPVASSPAQSRQSTSGLAPLAFLPGVQAPRPAPVPAASSAKSGDCESNICVQIEETDDSIRFFIENQRYFDIAIRVAFPKLENLRLEPTHAKAIPARGRSGAEKEWLRIIPARKRLPLLVLRVKDTEQEWSYRYQWWWNLGDPAASHRDQVRYALPFDGSQPRLLLQGIAGSFSHTEEFYNSFDFKMPIGTMVTAARGGVVARVVDVYLEGGASRQMADRANLITIRHTDGTYGEYVHLDYHGALVREGQTVKTGEPLARSGNTGFSSEPHLHFMVWKALPSGDFESLPIRFDDGTPEGYVPKEDLWYGDAEPINRESKPARKRSRSGS